MWALVPVKALSRSKARLAAVLSSSERADLVLVMLADVLEVLETAAQIARIMVLTDDPRVARLVRARGHDCVNENPAVDLNSNLDQVAGSLIGHVERLLVIPADVPAATREDIETLQAGPEGAVTLVPASVDGGTNAVVNCTPYALPFAFGEQSFTKHRAAAQALGLGIRVVERENLGRDMDRPEDLLWLLDHGGGGETAAFLRGLDLKGRCCAPGLRNTG